MLSEHINRSGLELIQAAAAIAPTLPPSLYLGTSSWTYRGWEGLIYNQSYKSEAEFNRSSLAEYATCPLFRTTGIDSSFYRPPEFETLERYQAQVPAEFRFVMKCFREITLPFSTNKPNAPDGLSPSFLNAELFDELMLPPIREFKRQLGAVVLQFGRMPLGRIKLTRFLERLSAFLSALSPKVPFAIEIRNRELLIPEYFKILNSFNVAHCFNSWEDMASMRVQMQLAAAAGGLTAPLTVARAVTHPGYTYKSAGEAFSPFSKLCAIDPSVRRDLLNIMRRGVEKKTPTYILISNKAEGSSPLTLASLMLQFMAEKTAVSSTPLEKAI